MAIRPTGSPDPRVARELSSINRKLRSINGVSLELNRLNRLIVLLVKSSVNRDLGNPNTKVFEEVNQIEEEMNEEQAALL